MIITIDTDKGRVQSNKEHNYADLQKAQLLLDAVLGNIMIREAVKEYKEISADVNVVEVDDWNKFLDAYKNSNK